MLLTARNLFDKFVREVGASPNATVFISAQGADRQVNVDASTRKAVLKEIREIATSRKFDRLRTVFASAVEVVKTMVEKVARTPTCAAHSLEGCVQALHGERRVRRHAVSIPRAADGALCSSRDLCSRLARQISGRILKGQGWQNDGHFRSLHVDVLRAWWVAAL